jgi:predicted metal-dependent HD superfamily phosphohydrolase
MPNSLKLRLNKLIEHFNANTSSALYSALYSQIAAHYAEKGRYYHNLSHLQNIFRLFDSLELSLPFEDLAILEWATWFHDVIYDSRAKDNEECSAELAAELLPKLNVPTSIISATCQIILDTKRHIPSTDEFVNLLFLDLDLAILGSSPKVYDSYAKKIRQEYAWVEEEAYQTGRLAVLQNFAGRAKIYFTEIMYDKFENFARENLEREIQWLKQKKI